MNTITHSPIFPSTRPHAPRVRSVFGDGAKALERGRLTGGLPIRLRADDAGEVRDVRGGPFASRVVGRVCPAPRPHGRTCSAGGSSECRPWIAASEPERTAGGWRVRLTDGRTLELATLRDVEHAPLCDHAAPLLAPRPECGHRFVSLAVRSVAADLAAHDLAVRMVGSELGRYVTRFQCEVSHVTGGGRGTFTIEYWRACDVYPGGWGREIPAAVVRIVGDALEAVIARIEVGLDDRPYLP